MDEGEKTPQLCSLRAQEDKGQGQSQTCTELPVHGESGSGSDEFCVREGKVGSSTKLDLGSLSWRAPLSQHSWMETANTI